METKPLYLLLPLLPQAACSLLGSQSPPSLPGHCKTVTVPC